MGLVRCPGDQCHIFLRALPGLLCTLFLGILQLNPIVCRRLLQAAGLCLQHSAGTQRDSGPVTMRLLEEALVLFWLLSVFLRCPGR